MLCLIAGSVLLSGVEDDVVRRVNDYSAQHIALTTWAFAKLEASSRPALMQVTNVWWPSRCICQTQHFQCMIANQHNSSKLPKLACRRTHVTMKVTKVNL